MNIYEDNYDNEGNYVGLAQNAIPQLAQQSNDNFELLARQLTWLVRLNSLNAQIFGYELGKRDKARKILELTLKEQESAAESASPYLLGGYLAALFKESSEIWEATLDRIAENPVLSDFIPALTADLEGQSLLQKESLLSWRRGS